MNDYEINIFMKNKKINEEIKMLGNIEMKKRKFQYQKIQFC